MQATLPPEVPAQVRHANHVSNHISVQGGTNWDLSRSAVATPIVPLTVPAAAPEAGSGLAPVAASGTRAGAQAKSVAGAAPLILTVKFGKASSFVPVNMQKVLTSMPVGPSYLVVGHADSKEGKASAVALKRAVAVAKVLRKHGYTVAEPQVEAADVSAQKTGSAENRRVDVYMTAP